MSAQVSACVNEKSGRVNEINECEGIVRMNVREDGVREGAFLCVCALRVFVGVHG